MDELIQLPQLDVSAIQTMALWQRVPHSVLLIAGIIWQLELVEGKDSPSHIIPKFNNQGQTVVMNAGAHLWKRQCCGS